MMERIQELDHDQIARLKKLGHDTLAAISPPIASMIYDDNPDQLQALQNIGPDALGAMAPQLADMLYGPDTDNADKGIGQYLDPDSAEKGPGRFPGLPPIVVPPFPLPPDEEEPPDYRPEPGEMVVWWSFADACEECIDNANDPPRPYGETFSSGDVAPPAHDHCRCSLMSAMRSACPIHGHGNRIFELSHRF